MNPQMPILRLAGVMCYGDDEDALRLGPINYREGKIANKDATSARNSRRAGATNLARFIA
jgi:hypothetical protein